MHSLGFRLISFASGLLLLIAAGCGDGSSKGAGNLTAALGQLSGDADTKVAGLAEIAQIGPAAATAVDKITPLLKDSDPIVRRTAAYALGEIGPAAKSALPTLKEMLNTTDRDQLTAVANALRAIDPKSLPDVKIENIGN
ncbi:MAG TPA: HEAT repeat domain-containing protein [Verrucomicrobiota bacterium]|nr:hypothetical protein [Verrucomicrobiales bacterium]HRI14618.1 HEAT repeat domain-containing protein [Verrucomicrobiota bacterium]